MMDTRKIIATVEQLSGADLPVYLVGGAVRDRLMNRDSHDLDFVMEGGTARLARRVANALQADFYVLDVERDTSRVIYTDPEGEKICLDFARARSNDLDGDLRARDFSINAIAIRLGDEGTLIDPCGGVRDIHNKVLRACGPTSLEDDPARVLRVVRLAVGMDFRIEETTIAQARQAAVLIPRISAERRRDELVRMLEGDRAALCVRLLERLGGLEYVLPELLALKGLEQPSPHVLDGWEHTLELVDRLETLVQALTIPVKEESPAGLILGAAQATLGRYQPQFRAHLAQGMPNGRGLLVALKLAALYHDTGKATTASRDDAGRLHFYRHEEVSARLVAERARALAFSSEEVERCEIIVREHMRIHQLVAASTQPSPRSIYRFFRATGEAGVDVCLVSLADTWATYSHTLPQEHWLAELQVCRAILEARWEKDEEIVHPPRLLDGRELMAVFDLKPGPLIGALLEAIREAQAAGDVRGKEEALVVGRKWLEQNKDGEHVEPTR